MSAETLVQSQVLSELISQKVPVPDPLEGVIPGENRAERYQNFMVNVLGKIWPNSTASGEYGDDFWRTTRFEQGDISGYTHFSPMARDPLTLTPDEFETAVDNLGTADYVRVRSLPPQLLQPGVSIIPAGGSCVIETWGMRSTADLNAVINHTQDTLDQDRNRWQSQLQNPDFDRIEQLEKKLEADKQLLADTARVIVSFAPTITHLSGAMLTGQDWGIHYVESDMWTERLESYGIPKEEAEELTREAYSRINEAVARRAKLINPDATIININFDDLNVSSAVEQWFAQAGIPHNPDFRVAEVMYTYIGPDLLDRLRLALQVRIDTDHLNNHERAVAAAMIQSNLHMRGKQIDHSRWGSMNLPKEVIMGHRDLNPAEQERAEDDCAYSTGIRIMQDVYRRYTAHQANIVTVGFADIPGPRNTVQHESRDVGVDFTGLQGTPEFYESLKKSLTTPERLHRGNVDAHLEFLRSFTVETSTARQALIVEKNGLLAQISPVKAALREDENKCVAAAKSIEKNTAALTMQKNIIALVELLKDGNDANIPDSLRNVIKGLKDQKVLMLATVQKKSSEGKPLTPEDQEDLEEIPVLVELLEVVENGQTEVGVNDLSYRALVKVAATSASIMREVIVQRNAKLVEKEGLEQKIVKNRKKLEDLQSVQDQIVEIDRKIAELGTKPYFPLSENPFVHHAMQFLWDPDFVDFLQQAVSIQERRAAILSEGTAQRSRLQAELEEMRENAKVIEQQGHPINRDLIKTKEAEIQLLNAALKKQETPVKTETNERMRRLMAMIYPKLEAYINHLYGRIDYPAEIRSSRLLQAA